MDQLFQAGQKGPEIEPDPVLHGPPGGGFQPLAVPGENFLEPLGDHRLTCRPVGLPVAGGQGAVHGRAVLGDDLVKAPPAVDDLGGDDQMMAVGDAGGNGPLEVGGPVLGSDGRQVVLPAVGDQLDQPLAVLDDPLVRGQGRRRFRAVGEVGERKLPLAQKRHKVPGRLFLVPGRPGIPGLGEKGRIVLAGFEKPAVGESHHLLAGHEGKGAHPLDGLVDIVPIHRFQAEPPNLGRQDRVEEPVKGRLVEDLLAVNEVDGGKPARLQMIGEPPVGDLSHGSAP